MCFSEEKHGNGNGTTSILYLIIFSRTCSEYLGFQAIIFMIPDRYTRASPFFNNRVSEYKSFRSDYWFEKTLFKMLAQCYIFPFIFVTAQNSYNKPLVHNNTQYRIRQC